MINRCPVCRGDDDVVYTDLYRGNHDCFKDLKRMHCIECDLDFASPMPDVVALEKFNSDYFKTAHSGKPTNKVVNAFFSGIAQLRIAHVENYLSLSGLDKSISRVLEWGPGYGYFASSWLERNPDTIYHAVETDISCHSVLSDLGVLIVDEYSLPSENELYDLIVMSHVLEHVTDPLKFLNNAIKKLKKRGVIFIEVPCKDWMHKSIDEPHLLFFDKEPMSRLLEKVGFDDVSLSYHGKTIKELSSTAKIYEKWIALRSKLIDMGLIAPFSKIENGMSVLNKAIERAAVAPSKAHVESTKPAWWLRAVARKI